MKIKLDKILSYFIGVLHSDGCIYKFYSRRQKRFIHRIGFIGGKKSLPMLVEIREILRKKFKRKVKIIKLTRRDRNIFELKTSINSLLPIFDKLEISKKHIPSWIKKDRSLFCSYLAGVIDGDGNIVIKRKSSPQCIVRITSHSPNPVLLELIKRYLYCIPWIEKQVLNYKGLNGIRKNKGVAFRHCFCISRKNFRTFKKFVLPFIKIRHKKEKIIKFLKLKGWYKNT